MKFLVFMSLFLSSLGFTKSVDSIDAENFIFFGNSYGYYLMSASNTENPMILKISPDRRLIKRYHELTTKDRFELKTISVFIDSHTVHKINSLSKINTFQLFRKLKYITKSKKEVYKKIPYSSTLQSILFKTDPSLEISSPLRSEYLLFGNEDQLWVTHFKKNGFPFIHIMKIRTDLTVSYLLSRVNKYARIEGTDAENVKEPFSSDMPVVAKVKDLTTIHFTFTTDQEFLFKIKK